MMKASFKDCKFYLFGFKLRLLIITQIVMREKEEQQGHAPPRTWR